MPVLVCTVFSHLVSTTQMCKSKALGVEVLNYTLGNPLSCKLLSHPCLKTSKDKIVSPLLKQNLPHLAKQNH